jgi:hypothetical protein
MPDDKTKTEPADDLRINIMKIARSPTGPQSAVVRVRNWRRGEEGRCHGKGGRERTERVTEHARENPWNTSARRRFLLRPATQTRENRSVQEPLLSISPGGLWYLNRNNSLYRGREFWKAQYGHAIIDDGNAG